MCWLLWKNKNKYVFQQESGSVDDFVRAVECFAGNTCETNCTNTVSRTSKYGRAKWQPSMAGWIKINTDGAANSNGTWSTIGGVT